MKGEVAWIFCVPGRDSKPSDELSAEVSGAVGEELGKAFRPDRVLFVPALPKTRSAKIVRRAVRARASGEDRETFLGREPGFAGRGRAGRRPQGTGAAVE